MLAPGSNRYDHAGTMARMHDTLHTLSGLHRHEQDIRKSRFLAQAAPVASADEALQRVSALGEATATHNCWAYRIGQDYRFNDDGEVSGTGGRPILQAIEGQGFDRVLVVVTRWYGGTKLGIGGLLRAYGGTAAECLRQAEGVPIVAMAEFTLHAEFAELALLKVRLAELETSVEHETFGANGVELTLRVPEAHVEAAQTLVRDITRGRSLGTPLDPSAD